MVPPFMIKHNYTVITTKAIVNIVIWLPSFGLSFIRLQYVLICRHNVSVERWPKRELQNGAFRLSARTHCYVGLFSFLFSKVSSGALDVDYLCFLIQAVDQPIFIS